jgi:DNA-binding protein Fis
MVLSADKDNEVPKIAKNNRKHESLRFTDDKQVSSAFTDISHIKRYLKDLNKISLKDIQKEFIIRTEKKIMKEALAKTNWNRKKASILLNISYKSMLNKIKAYNLM